MSYEKLLKPGPNWPWEKAIVGMLPTPGWEPDMAKSSRYTKGRTTRTRPRNLQHGSGGLSGRRRYKHLAKVMFYGTGRRKNAIARVFLVPGEGRVIINNKPR